LTVQEEANKQVVMRPLLEACGQLRPEVWLEIMHPDYVIHHPWAKPGREAYMTACAKYWDSISPPRYDILHVLASGDLVMVHYVEHGTILGPVFGVDATGANYEKPGFGLYRIEDGLMREGWSLEDDLGFVKQLGITDYSL
jgi:predicted SnoaL-like aldol condensation-catalyzing enzyme